MKQFERLNGRLREKADDAGARAVVYVAVGDSVTQGCMRSAEFEYERVYHQTARRMMERRYPGTVVNTINSGVGGDTAEGSRSRWDRDVLMYRPDLVTICFGHNDVHAGEAGRGPFILAVGDLIRCVRSTTDADIALLTPCMMMKRDNGRIAEMHRPLVGQFVKLAEEGHLAAYHASLLELAEIEGIPCLDVYAMWESMELAGIDIHDRLANGINHPDADFHEQLGVALGKLLLP